MFKSTGKSHITDKLSDEIDKEENGIYSIGHDTEEEREATRRMFQKHKKVNDANKGC